MTFSPYSLSPPIAVGVIGTGYAAQQRVAALANHPWAQVVAIAGSHQAAATSLAASVGARVYDHWADLLCHQPLALVIIATKNHLHAAIAQAALAANCHVVCEYPLALTVQEATALIACAQQRDRLLHVEHIELLGSLHQAVQTYVPQLGTPIFARYTTISPKQPVTARWSYHHQEFGFPLVAALSRVSRFTALWGEVVTVSCRSRFWEMPTPDYYRACFCTAQLEFRLGAIAHITYAKGEVFPVAERSLILQGDRGTLTFMGDRGTLLTATSEDAIALGSRRGVFAEDTRQVLDHLLNGTPLYTTPAASLMALRVAAAAEAAAQHGTVIHLA